MFGTSTEMQEWANLQSAHKSMGSWRAVAKSLKETGYQDMAVNNIARVLWGITLEEME